MKYDRMVEICSFWYIWSYDIFCNSSNKGCWYKVLKAQHVVHLYQKVLLSGYSEFPSMTDVAVLFWVHSMRFCLSSSPVSTLILLLVDYTNLLSVRLSIYACHRDCSFVFILFIKSYYALTPLSPVKTSDNDSWISPNKTFITSSSLNIMTRECLTETRTS